MYRKITFLALILILILGVPLSAKAVDPYEYQQWYLNHIKAKQAWEITQGSEEIVVAIIDTGVDLDHPDLAANLWINTEEIAEDGLDNDLNGYVDDIHGWNFLDDNNVPEPNLSQGYIAESAQHGTFVAGLISAVHDNNFGIKGITAEVKIMPLVVLDAFGYGYSESVSKAVDYAVDNGADVINFSFAGFEYNDDLRDKLVEAYDNNVAIVAAAGNSYWGGYDLDIDNIYPICYDVEWGKNLIIGVSSLDQEDYLSYFSNFGETCVDISAPGEELMGLVFQDDKFSDLRAYISSDFMGSSFSAAMVSATIALMKSINPNLTNEQVMQILTETAVNIDADNEYYKGEYGAGLLDAYACVKKVYDFYSFNSSLNILISAAENKPGFVSHYNQELQLIQNIDIFGRDYMGLNVAAADLDGDGQDEILAAAAAKSMPFVRAVSQDNILISSFLAFEPDFKGGVLVAAGDVNSDSQFEYVIVPQSSRQPEVRIFNADGNLLNSFLAFDKEYTDGLTVSVGNLIGDQALEIAVGAPHGFRPEVRIFDHQGNLLKTVMAFVPQFTGGVNVNIANIDGQGYDEIVVGAGEGGGPHVRVLTIDDREMASFFAYNSGFHGGVGVAAGDINADGIMEIITVPKATGGPHVRIWDLQGHLLNEIFAFEADYTGGLSVAAGN